MDIILVAVKRIGLTGNLGCGKSTVARFFKELGAVVYDADRIIHGFYTKGHQVYEKVVEHFGKDILDADGNIDRRKLAEIVFSNREDLSFLEKLTHTQLNKFLDEEFSKLPEDAVAIVEASLLVEKGTYKNYDGLIVVYAPLEVCIERAVQKGLSREEAKRRLSHQLPPEEKLKVADWVIDSTGSLENTKKQVVKVFEEIRRDP